MKLLEDIADEKSIADEKRVILVVDDNSDNIISLIAVIDPDENTEVISVLNGSDALKKVKEQYIDMIFMDVQMPGKDGFETTKDILAYNPRIPVYFISGTMEESDLAKALDSGASGYFAKPMLKPAEIRLNIDFAIKKRKEQKLSELKYYNMITKMMNSFAHHELIYNDKDEAIDYRFLEVNPAWEKTLRMKSEDVVGKTLSEILPGVEDVWIKIYSEVVKTGKPKEFDQFSKSSGKHYHCFAYRTEPGKFAVFFNDTTKKRNSEKKLRESEQKLTNIIENSPDMTMTANASGLVNYVSPQSMLVLGYSSEYFMGIRIPTDFIHPDDRERVGEMFNQVVAGKGIVDFKYRFLRGDSDTDEITWDVISHTAKPITDDNGLLKSIQSNISNITEKEKLIADLKVANDVAVKTNAVKGEVLLNMSHEIRTPLNSIMGFTRLISDEVGSKNEDLAMYARTVLESGERLAKTTTDISFFSELITETYDFKPETLNLFEIVSSVIKNNTYKSDNKGLKVNFTSFKPDVPYTGNMYAMTKVVTELFDNSIKYTEKGGVDVSLIKTEEGIALIMKDTGIGIASENIDRMFESVSQESSGYTKKHQGLGMGLAIIKNVCDYYDIEVIVKTNKKVGSTFILAFEK